jgi:hypothetical protein
MNRHRLPGPGIDETRCAFVLTVNVEATSRLLVRDPWISDNPSRTGDALSNQPNANTSPAWLIAAPLP